MSVPLTRIFWQQRWFESVEEEEKLVEWWHFFHPICSIQIMNLKLDSLLPAALAAAIEAAEAVMAAAAMAAAAMASAMAAKSAAAKLKKIVVTSCCHLQNFDYVRTRLYHE